MDNKILIDTTGLKKSLDDLKDVLDSATKEMTKTLKTLKKASDSSSSFKKNIEDLIKSMSTIQSLTTNDITPPSLPSNGVSKTIGKIFPQAKPITDLIGGLFNFDKGGIVPGNFSQPVPVVAHGQEMILNPGQQAKLFKMLNGHANGGAGQAGYVYAPQIKTGASASEVFDLLNRHSRLFFSMVADGVQNDSSLRNSVRGAK